MAPKKKAPGKKAGKKASGNVRGKRAKQSSSDTANNDDAINDAMNEWGLNEDEDAKKTKPKKKTSKRNTSAKRTASATRKKSVERYSDDDDDDRERTPSRSRSEEKPSPKRAPAKRAPRGAKSSASPKKQPVKAGPTAKNRRKMMDGLDAQMKKVKPESVRNGRKLPIQVLDKFCDLAGMLPPQVLYWEAKYGGAGDAGDNEDDCEKKYTIEMMKPGCTHTQLHHIEDHYLVSHQRGGNVYIFDSINRSIHVNEVLPQLKLIYESVASSGVPEQFITYLVPQEQGATQDCGLFAAAWSVLLLHTRYDPMLVVLDQEMLREHMYDCLKDGEVSQFPTLDSEPSANANASRTHFDLGCGDIGRNRRKIFPSDSEADTRPYELVSGAIPSFNGFGQIYEEMFLGRHSLLGCVQIAVMCASILFLCIYFKEVVLPYFGFNTASLSDLG